MEYDYHQNWYVTVECKNVTICTCICSNFEWEIFRKSVVRTFDNIFEN